MDFKKLTPLFTRPYEVEKIINPMVIQLKLHPSFRVHPAIHVSLLKPVSYSPLCPVAEPPTLGSEITLLLTQFGRFWTFVDMVRSFRISWTREVMDRRSNPVFLAV